MSDLNARENIFEAIMVLVENSARDKHSTIEKLFGLCLQTLFSSLSVAAKSPAQYQDQENFLGLFQTIIRYDPSMVKTEPDMIMKTILQIIDSAPKDSVVKESAFSAIGTFAQAADSDFGRYMETVMPFISAALLNHEDYAVGCIVLGVIGDISRSLGDAILPYCEFLINQIGTLLQNPAAHRKLRPSCLFAIGDLSLAIGGRFEVYVHPVMLLISTISTQLSLIQQVKSY